MFVILSCCHSYLECRWDPLIYFLYTTMTVLTLLKIPRYVSMQIMLLVYLTINESNNKIFMKMIWSVYSFGQI